MTVITQSIPPPSPSPPPTTAPLLSQESFLHDAETLLLAPTTLEARLAFASALKAQLKHRLGHVNTCMLPSYHHLLPTGRETGRIVAIDLGGTTLRIALVELRGRRGCGGGGYGQAERRESADLGKDGGLADVEISNRRTWRIGKDVRDLVGMEFFLWLAGRIAEAVADRSDTLRDKGETIPLALAWSFPVHQTSLTTGLIQPMGKGFRASDGLLNHDLATVLRTACLTHGLSVSLRSIMNDSDAALFSEAYARPGTRMGLILGTGANVSCYLPVASLTRAKFGNDDDKDVGGGRDPRWFDAAAHVVVNVELGCCGQAIMPFTRWDERLRRDHANPDFQPFEYFTSGKYLGEICRLALVEAVKMTGTLGGVVPPALVRGYTLNSEVMSAFEADTTPTLGTARAIFTNLYPSTPTLADLILIKRLSHLISTRSGALVAAALYALWDLRRDCETTLSTAPDTPAHFAADARAELALATTVVSYNGAVIEQYPGYRDGCQRFLDELVRRHVVGSEDEDMSVELVAATESSLLGAAVAAACLVDERQVIAEGAASGPARV